MHRFSTRESRSKPKTNIPPIYSTRARSLSALSLLQTSQIQARASSVVRKVLGARSPLKEPTLFDAPTERASCDKPRSSTDSTTRERSRPRSNTTPTEITWPKNVITPPANHDTLPASPCTSGSTQTTPPNSLLFSPTPSTPPPDEQEMETAQTSPKRPTMTQGSPEIDSGYASGHSSAVGSAPPPTNGSPVITRTPRSLGKATGIPLTPGGMSMRLSPSLPRSIMPMPILNLPPLPPTPVQDHTLPRARSFHPEEMRHVKKAMPALMRHGTSNMAVTHAEEEEDDDDGSSDGSDSDSSDTDSATPEGDSSPDAHDSIDESIEESTSHSGSEDAHYFDAREMHTPSTSDDPSGLATPRASDQNRILGEASALGLQITPTPGPSTITGSSPWTMVDITPGVDRAANGHPPRSDYFSHPVASARQALKSPHRTPRVSQLISLASPRANGLSPRAAPAPLSPCNTIAARRARAATVLRDPNGESPRPALYQQMSHSMMNLSSPPPPEGMALTGLDALRTPCERAPIMAATPGSPAPMLTPLMRRNSMPTLIRHPPNYDDLYPSVPREEEGKEKLPRYSCGVHIEAMMPRKMEFSAPGVLAKDRSWKKQYVVVHGTTMMIYKNDIRKMPIGGKVKGKEKYEGVVTEDEVDLDSATVHLPGHESAAPRIPLNPPTRRGSTRAASTGASDNGSRSSLLSRFHGNSSRTAVPQSQETPAPGDKASASESTVSISAASSSTSTSTRRWSHNQASVPFASSLPHFNPPFSSGNQLIRQYTLQRAECGLGSDYYKRRNVIRVRCEGEQFLLQADSVMQVVDWIECLQAGTNAALDLDERPMTKPPPFPRRRRRRRVRPADGANETNGTSGVNNNTSNNNTNQ